MLISGSGGMAGKGRENSSPLRRIKRAHEWSRLRAVGAAGTLWLMLLLLLRCYQLNCR
jgi:hypothetical protein